MSLQQNPEVAASSEDINLNEILKPYLRRWWWFVLTPLLFGLLTFLYLKTINPQYNIVSTVLIKDARNMGGDLSSLSNIASMGSLSSDGVDNEIVVFKSKDLMTSVVKELGLETNIYREETFRNVELYKDSTPILVKVLFEKPNVNFPSKLLDVEIQGNNFTIKSPQLKNEIKGSFGKTVSFPFANIMIIKNKDYVVSKRDKSPLKKVKVQIEPLDKTVESYQKLLLADVINKKVTIIELSLKHSNKHKAIDIINSLVANYNRDALLDKNAQATKTAQFIDDRIVQIGKDLGEVEDKKERFKQANNITDIPTEAGLGLQVSSSGKSKLVEVENQLQIINSLLSFVNSKGKYDVLPTNVGLEGQSQNEAIAQYNELILKRNNLLENATDKNPLVLDITKQINSLRNVISESLKKTKDGLSLTESNYLQELNRVNSRIAKIPAQEKMFRSIERQQQIKESLYLLLLEKRETNNITLTMSGEKARIIDYAYSSIKPVSPRKLMLIAGGLFIGFLLPLVFIYFRQLMQTAVITKSDISKLTKLPVIAEIPRVVNKSAELIKVNDVSPMSEAFRILATNFKFMLPKTNVAKKIFVTSTIKGEGKTFVSINLAAVLSNAKNRVLVIGSDVRNPQLQRYSPEHKYSIGLSEYLTGAVDDIEKIIYKDLLFKNCDVIFSGAIPPNPTDLLENGKYQELLKSLENRYEYIVLDTSPLMLVTDSFIIVDVADAILYVTRSELSEKAFMDFLNNNVQLKKLKNVGIVLNDVHQSNFGYGNKYGYGYAENVDDSWFSKFKKIF